MTRLANDPANFSEEMLDGFCSLYPQYVLRVPGGVVRAFESPKNKVAVVVGGGSGHYPAFCGVVGPGFADGAVVGNIFSSPSTEDAYSVGKIASSGGGLLFITGNYAGDVLNFDQAQIRLQAEGLTVSNLYVTDDVASAPADQIGKRRGIAGGFVVFKIASAAAELGNDFSEVTRLATKANELTRTFGVAFDGCTLPGSTSPLFTMPTGKMGLGMGIHGEPGISEDTLPRADDLAQILVNGASSELRSSPIKKIAVILNGLGATKYEELFVLWKSVSQILGDLGYEVIEPEVGEIVTSLDMAGCSLTITLLDCELENLWRSPANTPAYKKGVSAPLDSKIRQIVITEGPIRVINQATIEGKKSAIYLHNALTFIRDILTGIESDLGAIDAIAGDGDHGRGMTKGINAAVHASELVISENGDPSTLLIHAGEAWAAKAGGTSGILWGAALRRAGESISNSAEPLTPEKIIKAVCDAIAAIQEIGHAQMGDKTMLDSMIPFLNSLSETFAASDNLPKAWKQASEVASEAAAATALLSPKIGRARPLAERSKGTPDAGAISFSKIVEGLSVYISQVAKGIVT